MRRGAGAATVIHHQGRRQARTELEGIWAEICTLRMGGPTRTDLGLDDVLAPAAGFDRHSGPAAT
jgi:hypothetical protein